MFFCMFCYVFVALCYAFAMFWYVLLYFAMFCYAFAVFCYVSIMLSDVFLCFANFLLCFCYAFAMFSYALLCFATCGPTNSSDARVPATQLSRAFNDCGRPTMRMYTLGAQSSKALQNIPKT